MFNVVATFPQRLGWWRCWLWPSMLGSLPRWLSCRRGKLTPLSTARTTSNSVFNLAGVSSRLQVSRVYFPLPWSPSCPGSITRATQGGVSPGRPLHSVRPQGTPTDTRMDLICQVWALNQRLRNVFVLFLCVFVAQAVAHSSCLYPGSRCCFTHNTHAQGATRGYRGGNTSVPHIFMSSSLHLQWCFEQWRTFCLPRLSGRLGFYAQVHQKWCGQGESKAGPHSAGTAGQGTRSPSVSHNNTQFGHQVILMHLVNV